MDILNKQPESVWNQLDIANYYLALHKGNIFFCNNKLWIHDIFWKSTKFIVQLRIDTEILRILSILNYIKDDDLNIEEDTDNDYESIRYDNDVDHIRDIIRIKAPEGAVTMIPYSSIYKDEDEDEDISQD